MGIYERLSEVCKQNGTTITAFMRSIGKGSSGGTNLKSVKKPDPLIIREATERFNVSAAWLLGTSEENDAYNLNARERNLIDALRSNSETVRETVFKMAEAALGIADPLKGTEMARVFLSQNGQVLAHYSRATRPYPKQVQAASKRTGARVWKGVEGKTAAGPPITTVAADDQRVMVPVKYTGAQYFIVQVEGDSMAGVVEDGAFVVLDRLGHFDDGRVVLVQADGPADQPEATLKRIFRRPGDRVELRSENPKYPPMSGYSPASGLHGYCLKIARVGRLAARRTFIHLCIADRGFLRGFRFLRFFAY